ncbi:hypothetical protein ACTU45_04770 [Streptomyces sp. 24-1644]|uniref:hypothetical protein n=1 Tax=Streptomyces sp. 24-1644 TaxID=3457315 RepID=UPI003FA692A5
MTNPRITQLRLTARTTPARAQARRRAQEGGAEVATPARRPRRVGRPRGPQRVALATRILPEDDAWLTATLEQTGLGLQDGVTEALRLWCKSMKVPAPTAQD